MNHQRTHLDLFSGIGGFAIAAQNCGYTTIGFCEKEPYAQQIIKERFGAVLADSERGGCGTHRQSAGVERMGNGRQDDAMPTAKPSPRLHPDIFTLNGADYAGVDLLTGGFPCQPFSVAGKRLGKADDRAIWPEMLRVIQEARPTWIIGENVAGIVTMELDNILSDLESLGYSAWPLVIPACAVDARHRRDRVWIVAHASNQGPPRAGRESQRESKVIQPCNRDPKEGRGYVADAESGQDDGRNGGSVDAAEGRREGQHAAAHARGKDVAHADSPRVQGQRSKLAAFGEARQGRQSAAPNSNAGDQRGEACRWIPEPSIRRVADGIPEGLDSVGAFCQWPDEDLGTPRVSTGIKHRAHRLRGLGNSICPPVAEEIIRLIASLTPPFSAVSLPSETMPMRVGEDSVVFGVVAPIKGTGGILSGTDDLTTPSHAAATVRPAGPVTLHRSADGEVYFITPGRTL